MKLYILGTTVFLAVFCTPVYAMFKGKGKHREPEKTTQETQTVATMLSQGDAEAMANRREETVIENYKQQAATYQKKVREEMARLINEKKSLEEKMRQQTQELETKQTALVQENNLLKQEKESLQKKITELTQDLETTAKAKELTEKRITTLSAALNEAQETAKQAVESEANRMTGEAYPATAVFLAGAATGGAVSMAGRSLYERCSQQ